MNESLRPSVLDLMERYGIGEFFYAGPDGMLRISDDDVPDLHPEVLAEAPGLFFARHPAQTVSLPWPRRVRQNEIIGYLKIGPLLKPVRATQEGILIKPLVEDGSLAGYGEKLF